MPTTCPYTIEKVQTEDAREEALQIRFDVFIKEQGVSPEIEADAQDDDATHWLVRNTEGAAIATARVIDKGDGLAKIGRLAVAEAYRGQGIGRLLVQHIEADVKAQGFRHLRIHSEEYCVAFYQKQGFQVLAPEIFLVADIPHVALIKAL